MQQINLVNKLDEHSYINIQSGRCILCNKVKQKVLVCDNNF